MTFSEPFIRRPIATTLLTLAIALTGSLAFALLPVSPLPQVEFPTISVNANLAGASPETMAATVATPLERAFGSIAGLTELTSSSSLGSTRITLQFDLSKNVNSAAREVQAAINAARVILPTGLTGSPTYRKVNPAVSPIMIIALTSATMERGSMYDAASTVLAQRIAQIDGVGQVVVGGGALPAVRVALDLPSLNARRIALEDVRIAIAASNVNRPKGVVENGDFQWLIGANDQGRVADDYGSLVIAFRNGAPVRLSEVAQVTDGLQDSMNMGITDGKDAVLLIVYRQPNANILDTVDRVRSALPQLAASIPAAIDMQVVLERTASIRASLFEFERTMVISIGLVILVVLGFLRSGRATVIPAIAVLVSLLGTCAVLLPLGFSLNNLSLTALIVATGFVIDDAIVVLENTMRHIEQGVSPIDAALRGAREVSSTVVSMSLSLIAVFIPLLAMGGIIGRYLKEFAVTLSVAILVSLVVSLTSTPMLCAKWLKNGHRRGAAADTVPRGRALRRFKTPYTWVFNAYARTLPWALQHPKTLLLVFAATFGINFWLYSIVPKGFIPQQDIGILSGSIQADQASSFQSMSQKVTQFVELVRSDPAVEHVSAFTGGGQKNYAYLFGVLKPLRERGVSTDDVINRLRPKLNSVAGAALYMQGSQDLRVGGRQSGSNYQYTLQSDDLSLLRQWEPQIRATMAQLAEITDVNTDAQDKGLQTSMIIDRDAAARLGVTVRQTDATINDAFGQRLVSTIYEPLNQYRVVMQADTRFLQNPQSLNDVYLISSSGASVPLSAFTRFEPSFAALSVSHQGQFAASTISFNLAEGVSLGQASAAIDRALQGIGLPSGIKAGFQGGAKVFQESLASQPLLIAAALVTMFIVLGVLYESLVHPLTILSTLPSASAGAVMGLMLTNTEFNIAAFIGVILLIGLVKKNAIMMIDVAIEAQRNDRLSARAAIYRASLLRFRPIMMTTLAAMFGALPLALVTGDGAELRQPLGIAVVGGLLLSQILTLYTTPVIYVSLDRLRDRVRGLAARRRAKSTPKARV